MRKLFCLILFWFLCIPQAVFANGAGLPPFFLINGKLSLSNPIQTFGITASSFLIPQDLAPENYIVNQPILFEVEQTQLDSGFTPGFLKNVEYAWDFGDGVKAQGRKNSHTYTQIGSHILVLTIKVYTNESPTPTQFIDSFLLHIIPTANYNELPEAVIKVNGKIPSKNEDTNTLENVFIVNFHENITFEATGSKTSKAGIVEYLWNFGDGQIGDKPVVKHSYKESDYPTVVLRVKDKNGFISDTFVGLRNNPNNQKSSKSVVLDLKSDIRKYVLLLIGLIVLVGSYWWYRSSKK